MECKQIDERCSDLPLMQVVRYDSNSSEEPQASNSENIREEMRKTMMEESYSLLPKFFSALNAMKKDEKFVRVMLQVFKYTMPPYKTLELKERGWESFSDEFLREFGMELT